MCRDEVLRFGGRMRKVWEKLKEKEIEEGYRRIKDEGERECGVKELKVGGM